MAVRKNERRAARITHWYIRPGENWRLGPMTPKQGGLDKHGNNDDQTLTPNYTGNEEDFCLSTCEAKTIILDS